MNHYTIETIIRLKQKEIEKMANQSWRFAACKQESLFRRMVKVFTFTNKKESSVQNNCHCIGEC